MKEKYTEVTNLKQELEVNLDDQELAQEAAYVEAEYNEYKARYAEEEALKVQAALEAAEFGAPDEDFEETNTSIVTQPDGTIVTTITVTTATGTTTTTSVMEGVT
jgi:hypothetical protein